MLNTPDYGTTEVADHAVALALSLLRGVQAIFARVKNVGHLEGLPENN